MNPVFVSESVLPAHKRVAAMFPVIPVVLEELLAADLNFRCFLTFVVRLNGAAVK